MARIAVGGFRHLTNSFAPTRAGWDDLEKGQGGPPLARGDGLAAALAGVNVPAAGMIDAIREAGHEPVPLAWAAAGAAGPMLAEAFARMMAAMAEELAARGPVDAVALDLAGAMVTEHGHDGDAAAVGCIREAVGPDVPVAVGLDPRGNVSPALLEAASLVLPCAGARGGRRLVRVLVERVLGPGGRRRDSPAFALRRLPFLIPPAWRDQRDAIAPLAAGDGDPAGVALGAVYGFPYADVPHAGPAVIGFGADPEAVRGAVAAAADEIAAREPEWRIELLDPARAAGAALGAAADDGPVLLLDVQDDPGAGATGDGTTLLRALLEVDAARAVLGLLFDPHMATLAHKAGVGRRIRVALGGKHGIAGERPLEGEFEVLAAPELPVVTTGPVLGRASVDLAPFAALRLGGVSIVVAGRPVEAFDRAFFRACGIVPETLRLLALKSSANFEPDFGGIARRVIRVRAPGAAPADPAGLPFRHLRPTVRLRPLGPTLEEAMRP